MINKIYLHSILFCTIFFIGNSCISLKKSATKGAHSFYESFFVNDSTTQYFIKPIDFKNDVEIILDFTFRNTNTLFSPVTMNFSLTSKSNTPLENLRFFSEDYDLYIDEFKLLFKEKRKNNYFFRYTTKIEFMNLEKIISCRDLKIKINDSILTHPTKQTQNILILLKENLFEFELSQ